MGFAQLALTQVYEDNTIEWGNHVMGGRERAKQTFGGTLPTRSFEWLDEADPSLSRYGLKRCSASGGQGPTATSGPLLRLASGGLLPYSRRRPS